MLRKIALLLVVTGALFIEACTSVKTSASLSEKEEKMYLEKGQLIAQASFAALSGRLMGAMEQGGVPHALQYCNVAATGLIDSLSKVHQASIRRTSLKVRNPKDAPEAWEASTLAQYQTLVQEGKRPVPVVKALDAKRVVFASPIFMAQPCLKCHGKPGATLQPEHEALIKQLYPQDQAIGYVEGDWRGMWSITFFRK